LKTAFGYYLVENKPYYQELTVITNDLHVTDQAIVNFPVLVLTLRQKACSYSPEPALSVKIED